MSSPSTAPPSSSSNANPNKPSFHWYKNPAVSMFQFPHLLNRKFSSASSGQSNIVVVETEEQFNSSLRKVQDESLPVIFYYTAVWCSPCRLLSPIIGQLSETYPHVTTYKVDIDHHCAAPRGNSMSLKSLVALDLLEILGQCGRLVASYLDSSYTRERVWVESSLSNTQLYFSAYSSLLPEWKKITEVVGADVQRLKNIMEKLYK